MSVVVAVKQGDRVWLGADTQTTVDNTERYNYLEPFNYKIAKLENGLILACTGDTTLKQIVVSHPEWFSIDEKKGLTKGYIVTEIIPKLYETLKQEELLDRENETIPPFMKGSIVLAYQDCLFKISIDFRVTKHEDYLACGSGTDAAEYGLSRIDKTKDINEQLLKLMQISEKQDSCVSGPFIFIDTKDLKFSVKEGK